ncbi:MAG TPA: hypothetical protein VGL10_07445 [Gammaproteobacteria bacterium]
MWAKHHLLFLFSIALGCSLIYGCSNPGGHAAADGDIKAFRIIIGFAEKPRLAPGNPRLIADLEHALNCRLESLHAAAQAHIYICHTTESADSLILHLNKLAERGDIRYAEIDEKRK